MSTFNFTDCPSRWGIHAGKYADIEKSRWAGRPDVIPYSTADMDLCCAPEVVEAIKKLADMGLYGYGNADEDFTEAVLGWLRRRHHWEADPEWLMPYPGVVPAIFNAVQAFSEPGDEVIIQTPVYFPFRLTVEVNGRKLVENSLVMENGRYVMDYEDLEKKCKTAKILILCSPHNPVGRVWTRGELIRMGEICNRYGVLVVADEIHHDLVFAPHVQTCYAALGDAFADRCLIMTAASKSFNLAGFTTSAILIPNPELRDRFRRVSMANGMHYTSYMGPAATIAAFNHGEAWLDALLEHLGKNDRLMRAFFAEYIPEVTAVELEGTYLEWLDMRGLGMDDETLDHFLKEDCGLYLNTGISFGHEGAGHMRLNIACPTSLLEAGLERLYQGLTARGGR